MAQCNGQNTQTGVGTYDEELAPADVARVEEVRLGGDALLVVVLEPARVRSRPDVGAVGVGEVLLGGWVGRFGLGRCRESSMAEVKNEMAVWEHARTDDMPSPMAFSAARPPPAGDEPCGYLLGERRAG